MEQTKNDILTNQFIYKLREKFQIDEKDYGDLINSLTKLKTAWEMDNLIDKELMAHIYVIPNIIRGQFRNEYTDVQQKRLRNMEIEIDNLIIDMLRDKSSQHHS